ncbi:MAG: hypothetical protein P8K76_02160 [Candidatus Binatia bacterium]|nr:hypothetical protein [Candidatus Binatia bacterium]MDG2008563.1 hypothetical protein [Candidatus Binatia bacterium]
MKTTILTLAVALAFSFTATPADALDVLAKCRVYNAKIKMNYAKCLELDKVLVEKGKAAKGICGSRRTASLEKATAKVVTKLGVRAADCGIDTDTADADQALQWLASGDGSLTAEQEAALAGTAADITSDNPAVCEAAGGTWENDACTASSNYDCALGAICSFFAEKYPQDLRYYTNYYFGDTAVSKSCNDKIWRELQSHAESDFVFFAGSISGFSEGGSVNDLCGPYGQCDNLANPADCVFS